jgi:hypothetical protein
MHVLSAEFVARYAGRMLNIHPSLLPSYPGLNTHARALAAGDAEAGCTVHEVTAALDDGPILGQGRVPVLPSDTPENAGRAGPEAGTHPLPHRPATLRRRRPAAGPAGGLKRPGGAGARPPRSGLIGRRGAFPVSNRCTAPHPPNVAPAAAFSAEISERVLRESYASPTRVLRSVPPGFPAIKGKCPDPPAPRQHPPNAPSRFRQPTGDEGAADQTSPKSAAANASAAPTPAKARLRRRSCREAAPPP